MSIAHDLYLVAVDECDPRDGDYPDPPDVDRPRCRSERIDPREVAIEWQDGEGLWFECCVAFDEDGRAAWVDAWRNGARAELTDGQREAVVLAAVREM